MICTLLTVATVVAARSSPLFSITDADTPKITEVSTGRKLFKLVTNQVVLPYHNGPILSGSQPLSVYVTWYGTFTDAQKAIVTDFFASFSESNAVHPSVASWWKLTQGYKDSKNAVPSSVVKLVAQTDNNYSLGKTLKTADIETLVTNSLATFPTDPEGIYFVFTAEDVYVDGFCMNTCASHSFTSAAAATKNLMLPYSWVGNSAKQCPGQCAWPYALPQYGPQNAKALIPPNGDVGIDGMIINVGSMLAGTATDPFNNGYYQGAASAPLESATACTGIYGAGAYPGYPGQLTQEKISGASYNVLGVNTRKYLVPALWDPVTMACTPPS